MVNKDSRTFQSKLLGNILLEADLVSSAQIEVALQDRVYFPELRIGEVLAIRGWLKQDTADFFAMEWQNLIQQKDKEPIGYYLQKSGLLEIIQVEKILKEHYQTGVRFGTVAVLQGLIKSSTLDFFLTYLFPNQMGVSPLNTKNKISPARRANKDSEKQQLSQTFSEPQQIDDSDEIVWIG